MFLALQSLSGFYTGIARNALGALGELWVMNFLTYLLGNTHIVIKPRSKCMGDLLLVNRDTSNLTRIEVKTSQQNADSSYKFALRTKQTNVKHADFLIVLTVDTCGLVVPFVMTTNGLPNYLELPKNVLSYNGKYKLARYAWDILC